jgi:hypothetical protein
MRQFEHRYTFIQRKPVQITWLRANVRPTGIIYVKNFLVEDIGVEPMTLCVQGRCSSQLS